MTLAYAETAARRRSRSPTATTTRRARRSTRAADVVQRLARAAVHRLVRLAAGELERRCGDLAAARAAVDDGLDAIEFCSEDLPRIALLSRDRRARSRPTPPSAPATSATTTAERDGDRAAPSASSMRAEACAEDARARSRRARLAQRPRAPARARAARPTRRSTPRRPRRWRAVARPVPGGARAAARAREALVARGDRDDAAGASSPTSLATRARRSARRGCAARPRASPAGRGCRSRDAARRAAGAERRRGRATRSGSRRASARCSRWWPSGATNREIGAQLFMAEKTASVHVSRILAKLDVRSRTEAAAVAHRFGL